MPHDPDRGDPGHFPRIIPGTTSVFHEIGLTGVADGSEGRDAGDTILDVLAEELGVDVRRWIEQRSQDPDAGRRLAAATADLGMEAFGCYLPWHAFAKSTRTLWGMYFFVEALLDWAMRLHVRAPIHGFELTVDQAVRLAYFVTYRHELFHFHVERFAIRQEVIQRQPVFRPYIRNVRSRVANTDEWYEEALAQAVVLRSRLLSGSFQLPFESLRDLLLSEFDLFGPGYRNYGCHDIGGADRAHRLLGAQIATATRSPHFELTGFTTPKQEYVASSALVPGYAVFSQGFIGQFQLQMPTRRQWKRYASKHGYEHVGPGPGDHELFDVGGKKVHINPKGKEVDIASMKDAAKTLDVSLRTLLDHVRSA